MESWSQNPEDMPDLMDTGVLSNPDDWEDWLRWDPSHESLSPDNSSKDSTDSPSHDSTTVDGLPWLDGNATLAPPLIVDDSSFTDFSSGLDSSALNFSTHGQTVDPFIFGNEAPIPPLLDGLENDTNKRLETLPWPSTEVPSQPVKPNTFLTTDVARRKSNSPTTTSPIDSHLPSPASHMQTHSSASSLSPQPAQPPKKKAGRKRKSEMATKEGTGSGEGEPPVKKTSHNVIEKRYRNNLNDKILELRDSVPSLRAMAKPNGEEDDSEELDGLAPAHKLNKSTIMAKATEYIKHLEKRNKTLADEMAAMKSRLAAVEQTFARNSSASGNSGSPALGRSRPQLAHGVAFNSPMLQSSEQLRQRNALQQQMPTFDSQPDEDDSKTRYVNGNGGSGIMGKLMVGSMAGLMVIEGFAEHEHGGQSSSSRGLFAAPVHFVKRGAFGEQSGLSAVSASQTALPLLKISLLLTAVVYLILPLFQRRTRKKATSIPQITLTTAPSLAVSVEVKRKAWQTAIQSVWTPRHFLIEVVLVTVRIIELSLRRIIGFDRYAEFLGMTKDDEAARIKAWDIAIDAQLAGGDVEVSYYRLLLTLMASGTLPDSPIRLMQKAVHFRIFFWELANAGYGNLFMFKDFTARVARIYWDSARNQQRALVAGSASKVDELNHTIELLPDHLAKLIELECDEVLTDDMIQRAYNLAWNRPSAEKTQASVTLDTVVHDPAIRSPLDAVAAWFSNIVIDEGLALSVHKATDDTVNDVKYLTDLAASTAPPASSTLTRALVAKSVLQDESREATIAAALESMPHAPLASPMLGHSSTTGHLNVVHHVPLTPEVRTALTLAKLLSLVDDKSSQAAKDHASAALDNVAISSKGFTLLTAIAAYKTLEIFGGRTDEMTNGKMGLERLAGNLRVWVGTRAGRNSGLSNKEKGMVIKQCVRTAKRAGGWKDEAEDSGYGSGMSRSGSGKQVKV
ncbi:Sterol regulatory element-binding protein 1 [Sphaceloma murrayae]|uniref:Sterol regulatory element-binding protein 1 n=1 Tax=Sphaceloma murrayae TaxID=2082308 RepID=A0A2K1QNW0_9PEZI|nr:Sterol regulatory element-binding protein 1 [Sphaceloma murrayae]